MLKAPNSTADFIVTPSYFLNAFNVYDRDELEEYLNTVDVNEPLKLCKLLIEKVFSTKSLKKLSAEHKKVLINVLQSALEDENYDFGALLSDSDENCFYLPSEWDIEDPRTFFEQIYKVTLEEWKDSL